MAMEASRLLSETNVSAFDQVGDTLVIAERLETGEIRFQHCLVLATGTEVERRDTVERRSGEERRAKAAGHISVEDLHITGRREDEDRRDEDNLKSDLELHQFAIYDVPSESDLQIEYTVEIDLDDLEEWRGTCTCKDYQYRGRHTLTCKHIRTAWRKRPNWGPAKYVVARMVKPYE
jgi:hypothetical protein